MDRITSLFGIKYPIIQGGMVWCSGWRLASAVSNTGGLGLLGAGSMHPETLREHIQKCRAATHHSFGVNIPLMYPQIEEIMRIVVDEGVRIVFTSAGNPKAWTGWLKKHGVTVVHVVSSSRFAMKAEAAGVDAIVAEGFEAGGHNGREETTTLCLIPAVRAVTALPLIAVPLIETIHLSIPIPACVVSTNCSLTGISILHDTYIVSFIKPYLYLQHHFIH